MNWEGRGRRWRAVRPRPAGDANAPPPLAEIMKCLDTITGAHMNLVGTPDVAVGRSVRWRPRLGVPRRGERKVPTPSIWTHADDPGLPLVEATEL